MGTWLVFFRERVPLISYLLIAGGIAAWSSALEGGKPAPVPLLLGLLGTLWLLITLRIMDDIKDIDKDSVAHPERPLVRGLMTLEAARKGVSASLIGMVLMSVGFATTSFVAGALYFVVTAWAYLMFREFFVGKKLQEYPVLYAISHQAILFPLATFVSALEAPSRVFSYHTVGEGLLLFGAFFAYEVGRKYNPADHPILKTYRQLYGPKTSAGLIAMAIFVAIFGSYLLGILDSVAVLLTSSAVLVLILGFLAPQKHRIIELIVSITLAFAAWAPVIASAPG